MSGRRPLAALGVGLLGVAMLAGCAPGTRYGVPRPGTVYGASAGGGTLDPLRARAARPLVEVRGYVLAPEDSVPADAIGYAVPVFTSVAQAARFCPLFLQQFDFAGALDSRTRMTVRSYGHTAQIAPFVWPVTRWGGADRATCANLVARYNLSGAKIFYTLAAQAIRENGGTASHVPSDGPFIVTARRVSGTVMVYDLSRAPDNDYDKWLKRSARQLTDPALGGRTMVTPGWRDQMRFYVFGSIGAFRPIIDAMIPGFTAEHDK